MPRGSKLASAAAGAGLLFALGASIVHLFALRHAEGDVYAPGSTLRTDPLGAKGLLASLGRLNGVEATQNFKPLADLAEDPDATLVLLEVNPEGGLAESEMAGVERFARSGGRVVIAFAALDRVPRRDSGPPPWGRRATPPPKTPSPSPSPPPPPTANPQTAPEAGADSEPTAQPTPEPTSVPTPVARPRRTPTPPPFMPGWMPESATWRERLESWGVAQVDVKSTTATLAAADAPAGIAPEIKPATVLEFEIKDKAWRPIYLRGANAQVAEGRLSQGSVVLFADARPFSNEALAREPDPALIAWAMGPGRRVVFDETHLGLRRADSLMSLARKYRLHWTLAPLALLAALFIWRGGSPLAPRVPGVDHESRRGELESRDAFEGSVNLLRRNIAQPDLAALCLEEWRKSGAPKPPDLRARLVRAESLPAVRDRNAKGAAVAAAYNELVRILSRRS